MSKNKTCEEKLANIKMKYRIICSCEHSNFIYPFEHTNKKICSWCGKYVYINEKEEFKEKITLMLRGI